MDPQILTFVELFLFSFFAIGWAAWEYRSVSRLQKKTREDAAAAAQLLAGEKSGSAQKPDAAS